MIIISGHAAFKSDMIDLKNADKITYNETTKEVIATGSIEFTTSCELQLLTPKAENNRLRYTVGENIVYLD